MPKKAFIPFFSVQDFFKQFFAIQAVLFVWMIVSVLFQLTFKRYYLNNQFISWPLEISFMIAIVAGFGVAYLCKSYLAICLNLLLITVCFAVEMVNWSINNCISYFGNTTSDNICHLPSNIPFISGLVGFSLFWIMLNLIHYFSLFWKNKNPDSLRVANLVQFCLVTFYTGFFLILSYLPGLNIVSLVLANFYYPSIVYSWPLILTLLILVASLGFYVFLNTKSSFKSFNLWEIILANGLPLSLILINLIIHLQDPNAYKNISNYSSNFLTGHDSYNNNLWLIFFNALVFVYPLYLIGYRSKITEQTWLKTYGLILLSLVTLVKFFDLSIRFLDRGIFFVVFGILILIIALMWRFLFFKKKVNP